MKVFINGSSGFIGQYVLQVLQRQGHKISWTFNSPFDEVDAVIHLSAQAGVRPSEQIAFNQYNSNVMQTINLLEQCREYKLKKFIFISSSSVYGNPSRACIKETDRTDRPLCHYAATKKAGELACYSYYEQYGMDVTVFRPFTVYGPGQNNSMAIPTFTRLISEGKPVTLFGDGSVMRDYVYVQDVAEWIVRALYLRNGFDVYNLGSGEPTPLNWLVEEIGHKLGKSVEIKYVPFPKGEAGSAFANIKEVERALSYSPEVMIDEGINKYIDWYLKEEKNATS